MEIKNSRSVSLVAGSILLFIGVVTLLGNLLFDLNFWSFAWPLLVMAGGGVFFAFMATGGKEAAPLAIPGTIIGGIGLMLFFQNLTDHWESWAYGWTVIIMLVGLGIYIMGVWGGSAEARRSGREVLRVGAILFVIFGSFFELLFSAGKFSGVFFPVLLILVGVYLVFRRASARETVPVESSHSEEPPVMDAETSKPGAGSPVNPAE